MTIRNIIIEGVDRMGKGTLIEGLQQRLGYFQVIHYEKPKLLKYFIDRQDPQLSVDEQKKLALKTYQEQSFIQMFNMLGIDYVRYIMDRAHLGEVVYSPRYRKYSGDFVFEQEEIFVKYGASDFDTSTLLVLLTTSDFSFIQDDGLSFDFNKKGEEQEDFKKAFKRSIIKNKLMIDVSNGNGSYKPAEEILNVVCEAFSAKSK